MNGYRLLELARPVVLIPQQPVTASGSVSSNWINMAFTEKLALLIMVNNTGSGTQPVVTVSLIQSTNINTAGGFTSGTTLALNGFNKYDINQNTSNDTFTTTTGITAGTLAITPTTTNSTVGGTMVLLDIDPSLLTINGTYNHMRVVLTLSSAANAIVSVIAFQKFARIASSTAAPDTLNT